MRTSQETWHVLAAIRQLHEEIKQLRDEVKEKQQNVVNIVFPAEAFADDEESSSPRSAQSEP